MSQLDVSISEVYSLANKTEKDLNTYKSHTENSLKSVCTGKMRN